MIRSIKRTVKKTPNILVILVSTLIGLLLAEGAIRLFQLDWRYIRRFLYYQKADLQVHQPDPDVKLRYRLKPGVYLFMDERTSYKTSGYKVSINSLGARGPERSATKPEGVFRIVCVGGSNVYGAAVNDDETWPAQLEAKLNSISPGRYEVWNFGVSAFVPSQMVILAEEAIERYSPDLVIFALSNLGIPAFLWKAPIEPYFEKDPTLWERLFPKDSLIYVPFVSYETKIQLVQKYRLFRFALLGISSITGLKLYAHSPQTQEIYEVQNTKSVREFIKKYHGHVPIILFFCPAEMCAKSLFKAYYTGLDVPVFELKAEGMPSEYKDIHPPPYVMKWYAEKIAEWLAQNNYLPKESLPKSQASPSSLKAN